MRFAEKTTVSPENSRAEIEKILIRYGASGFSYATDMRRAVIKFQAKQRMIMFVLDMPDPDDKQFLHPTYRGRLVAWKKRTPESARTLWDQACRQRWRALTLVVKAKLEAVVSGITTFEEEFYAHIVMPGGKTLYEMTKDHVKVAYETGKVPPMLDWKDK